MRVQLALTCLIDGLRGSTGVSMVRVLEHVGCEVVFDKRQTCCGQPAFNAGDWTSSGRVASAFVDCFDRDLPIVVPSGSCAAMMREGFRMLGLGAGLRVFELAQFLMNEVGVEKWRPVSRSRMVVLHSGCHGRMLGSMDSLERLLALVPNLTVVTSETSEQCCGFGGTFSMSHPSTSKGIGIEKLYRLKATGASEVVSTDWGCLLHLEGLARREGIGLKFNHVADVLAEAFE